MNALTDPPTLALLFKRKRESNENLKKKQAFFSLLGALKGRQRQLLPSSLGTLDATSKVAFPL